MRKIILALFIVMAAASFAGADTIHLRDGRTINGTLLGFIDGRFVVRVEPRYAALPGAAEGMLIGAVGDDSRAPIMELGSSREFTADRRGRLYLTPNRGSYTDARGSFTVQIRRERDLTALDNQDDRHPRDSSARGRSRDRQPIDQID